MALVFLAIVDARRQPPHGRVDETEFGADAAKFELRTRFYGRATPAKIVAVDANALAALEMNFAVRADVDLALMRDHLGIHHAAEAEISLGELAVLDELDINCRADCSGAGHDLFAFAVVDALRLAARLSRQGGGKIAIDFSKGVRLPSRGNCRRQKERRQGDAHHTIHSSCGLRVWCRASDKDLYRHCASEVAETTGKNLQSARMSDGRMAHADHAGRAQPVI